ncbi:hypothetical protein [Psychroserpens sp.]|uniref:hypothetical protein n=1 Tax=Psychroserpens sp. TaxID=2020870 RepID=UPI00385E4EBB
MKFLSTLFFICFISVSAYSQSHKTILIKEANIYFDYMVKQNFDGVLDYMYPKVFEMAPREQMKAGMQQMFNAEDMTIQFLSNVVTQVTDTKNLEGITYAAIFYSSKMKMTFLTEEEQAEDDKKGFLMFMKATMQTQFGEDNVVEELSTMSLIIDMDATMFAIDDPKYKGWKFLGNDDAMATIVNSVIPESIRTELLNEKE